MMLCRVCQLAIEGTSDPNLTQESDPGETFMHSAILKMQWKLW